MARTGVQVDGLREAIRTLEKFGAEASDLKAAFKRIGSNVVNEAQVLAPVRSGKLASTIKPSNTKNKSVVRAGGGIKYAGVIHYGWPGHNIKPHPFLTTAVQNEQDTSIRLMEQEIQSIIQQLGLDD